MHVLCLWLHGFSYGAEVIWTGSCKWPQYGLNAARTYPETSPFTYVTVFRRLRTFIDRPAWCNLEVTPVTLACFFFLFFLTLLELPKTSTCKIWCAASFTAISRISRLHFNPVFPPYLALQAQRSSVSWNSRRPPTCPPNPFTSTSPPCSCVMP